MTDKKATVKYTLTCKNTLTYLGMQLALCPHHLGFCLDE